MNKKQFLEQLISRLKEADIVEILSPYVTYLKSQRGGKQALCPFHNDTKIGSFFISSTKGIFKCFACDTGGDAIFYVSRLKGISYIDAAFELGLKHGFISTSEYEDYFNKNYISKKDKVLIENKYKNIQKNDFNSGKKASDEDLDLFFNTFLDFLSLNTEHKEYLMKERGLSEEIIEKRKYKSNRRATRNNMLILRELLKEKGFTSSIFEEIPGFFMVEEREGKKWNYMYNKGIFIPIRNAKDQIIGLQIRRDVVNENGLRYFWFSSTFALTGDEKYSLGTSSGSPIDVIYPDFEKEPSSVLFITEGRFKSEAISKNFNSVAISLQGVTNWKSIDKEIINAEKEMKKRANKGFSRIYIAFDNDMSYKYPVYAQLKKMSNFIKEKGIDKDLFYVTWEKEEKGIDDLLASLTKEEKNYSKIFTAHKKDYFDTEFERQLKEVLKESGKKDPYQLKEEDFFKIKVLPEGMIKSKAI